MKKIFLTASSGVLATSLALSSCSLNQHLKKNAAITNPPCHFYAGRLDITWLSAYDSHSISFPLMQGQDSLPKNFTAYKINTQSLNSFLNNLTNIPAEFQIINLPVDGGNGCMLFQLRPSGTMSSELQKKFPALKSFTGISKKDANAQLRLDFDGSEIHAEITHDGLTELLSPWKDKQGTDYYLLYYKKDARPQLQPFKSY